VAEHLPQSPVHRDAHECDDLRTEFRDLAFENAPAFEVFGGFQHVDAGAGPRNEIGHANPPVGQPHVVFVRHRLGDEAGFVEEAPEAVRRTSEVMASQGRHHAGVDADEHHPNAGLQPIGQPKMLVLGLGPMELRL
jgi:hypothetical protein